MSAPTLKCNPECRVYLLSGRSTTLRLYDPSDDQQFSLTDFLHRVQAGFDTDDGRGTEVAIDKLPVPLLLLSNSMPDSEGFGESFLSTDALLKHVTETLESRSPDSGEAVLEFSLASKPATEETCGVRLCRPGLVRASQLRNNEKGYHFRYPVAFMIGD